MYRDAGAAGQATGTCMNVQVVFTGHTCYTVRTGMWGVPQTARSSPRMNPQGMEFFNLAVGKSREEKETGTV